MSAELIAVDGVQLRIGPWRGSERAAYLAPLAEGSAVSAGAVAHALAELGRRGFREVFTAAIPETQTRAFADAGFVEQERLHLLAHDLTALGPPPAWRATRRARPGDRDGVLSVDHRAFQPFWRLDAEGLDDAVSATPVSRFRVTTSRGSEGGGITGYAISGLAGRRGYLQRLAVDPDCSGRGLGSLLVRDGLRWLSRRGATSVLVNTQQTNERALALYLHLGFTLEAHQLVVLFAPVPGPRR